MNRVKPRLRGVWHKWACIVCIPLGLATVAVAAGDLRARVAAAIYALSVIALFGVSATYHRINWRTAAARSWMRRLDHTMIFVMIAGSYTPMALLVLHGPIATAILITVWAGAFAGGLLNLVWPSAPPWVGAIIYVALGWVAAAAVPQLVSELGWLPLSLLLLGGLLYTAGAVIYAAKRPDPAPTVFGYHEIFHALTIAAASVQYAVIAFWVLPRS